MIFYFSAEGNSRYVATKLGEILDEEVVDITGIGFDFNCCDGYSGKYLILVSPVYSWGLPVPMREFIKTLHPYRGFAYGVMTCGDDTGMAHLMMRDDAARRGVTIEGLCSIQMPNTYVILPGFDVDSDKVRADKLKNAPARIAEIAERIKNHVNGYDVVSGSMPRLKTSVIYPLFVKIGINTKKFHVTDSCSGCGLCAAGCPMNNITLDSHHKPVWGKNCVSCLKCYHVCSRHAVQYGQITRHKGQYFLHKDELCD